MKNQMSLQDNIVEFNNIAKSIVELRTKQKQVIDNIVNALQSDENSELLANILVKIREFTNKNQENQNNIAQIASTPTTIQPTPNPTQSIPISTLSTTKPEFFVYTKKNIKIPLSDVLKIILKNKPLSISAICKEIFRRHWILSDNKIPQETYIQKFFDQSNEFVGYKPTYKSILVYRSIEDGSTVQEKVEAAAKEAAMTAIRSGKMAPRKRTILPPVSLIPNNNVANNSYSHLNFHSDKFYEEFVNTVKTMKGEFTLQDVGKIINVAPKLLSGSIRTCMKNGIVEKVGMKPHPTQRKIQIVIWRVKQ